MKLSSILAGAIATASTANAYPGLDDMLAKISNVSPKQSTSLIGDLEHLPKNKLSKTGKAIHDILIGTSHGQDTWTRYWQVPPQDSLACARDTCCIWKHIGEEMRTAMTGTAGRCNSLARGAIRLGFHDAGGYSRKTGPYGGADGSLVLANECETRIANRGLGEICAQMRIWHTKYQKYSITMADLIQFGSNVGTVVCPLGPRVRSFIGRKDNHTAAPDGNLPKPRASADEIISMFADKSISPQGIVALLGAHTTSQQRFVYPNRTGDPQDSTPGVWDTRYFRETMESNPPQRVVKFPSDVNMANDPRTRGLFKYYGGMLGQFAWNEAYAREYVRLSLLGVHNINQLTECTKSLPDYMESFIQPDQHLLDDFLQGNRDYAAASLRSGDVIPQ